MKAQFVQNRAGVASFVLNLEGGNPGDAPCSLVVQRSTDQCYMGQGGMGAWTMKEESVVLPCERRGEELHFQLGPEYVNFLEPGNYRIRLRAGDAEVGQARMKIDSVQTEAIAASSAMQAQASREAPVAPATPAQAEAVTEPEPLAEAAPIPMPEPAPTDKGKSKLPLLVAALVLLALAGGVAYYCSQQGSDTAAAQNEQTAQAEKTEKERLAAEEAAKAEAEAKARAEQERLAAEEAAKAEAAKKAEQERLAAEAAAAAAQKADARGRARAFFASADKTPKAAVALAQELDATTDEQKDAIFRLFYYAANEDYAPAFTLYASCLDPTTPQWGTITKDGTAAWEFYRKANTPEGTSAADKVMEWVKQNAQSDARAREWLRQMKP